MLQLPRLSVRLVLTVTPDPGKADGGWYAADFPTPITIRDNVRLQRLLLDFLGVKHLMAIGGSMGSMVALEWAATYPITSPSSS